jgi:xanthine dehydrogenase small subunit
MRDIIRFVLGTDLRELRDVDPSLTVLEYLRGTERRCGTKEGCAEGDCGACTVVLGELVGEHIRYQAVNACIQFLPTLDGKQLVTVEDLKGGNGRLHPIQQALVESHGSQCGFCTPGFVMALYPLYRTGGVPERAVIDDALAGNLCRCTGYGPIIEAARRMTAIEGNDPIAEREAAVAALLRRIDDGQPVGTGHGGRRFYAPRSIDELARILLDHPEACVFCGATDVGLWVTKQHRVFDTLISLANVAELKTIHTDATTIDIGATVTYSEAHQLLAREYPDFGEIIRRFGSPQIRNLGTIGGNIANGSPIADSPPPLIALGTTLVLRRGAERRTMPLEDFFLSYGKEDRRPGEFVERIRLPRRRASQVFRAYKLSKRFDQDISILCGAFNLELADGTIANARLCYGGMAETPKRARHAEAALIGQPLSEAVVRTAMAALESDYAPITDHRGTATYRMLAAKNLLYKMYLETSGLCTRARLVGEAALAAE